MSHALFIESWSLKESLVQCGYICFVYFSSLVYHALPGQSSLRPPASGPASDQLRFFVHSSSLLKAAAWSTSFTGLLYNPVSVTPAQQHFRVSLEYFRMLILLFFCIDSAWPGWRSEYVDFVWRERGRWFLVEKANCMEKSYDFPDPFVNSGDPGPLFPHL